MASISRNQPGKPVKKNSRKTNSALAPSSKATLQRAAKASHRGAKKSSTPVAKSNDRAKSPAADSAMNSNAFANSAQQKRWEETRGLLQKALVDWEKTEEHATGILEETRDQILSERNHIEELLRKLKAKLEELS